MSGICRGACGRRILGSGWRSRWIQSSDRKSVGGSSYSGEDKDKDGKAGSEYGGTHGYDDVNDEV